MAGEVPKHGLIKKKVAYILNIYVINLLSEQYFTSTTGSPYCTQYTLYSVRILSIEFAG